MTEAKITFRDADEGSTPIKLIAFSGQLDETNVDSEAKKIYQVIEEMTQPNLILDFSNLEYMNSKSIGYVTDWYSQVTKRGGRMVILDPRPNILDILKVVGITQIIDIHKDITEAKKAFSAENAGKEAPVSFFFSK